MASRSNRLRRLERARVERRLARQAHRVRRRRQIQAGVGAGLALVLVVIGTTWLLGGFDPDPPAPQTAPECEWTPKPDDPNRTDVGTPPATGGLRSGFENLTISTDQGDISVLVDLAKVPCTAASFAHLSEQGFFANTACHWLDTDAKLLTCGDPRGDNTGGPTYQFPDEALPTEPVTPAPGATPSPGETPSPSANSVTSYYAEGTMIMANSGPNTNGSQFSIIYADGTDLPPNFSVVGTVTAGLEIVETVAQAGAVDDQGQAAAAGKPQTTLTIQQLYLGSTPPAPSPESPPPTSQPAPSAAQS